MGKYLLKQDDRNCLGCFKLFTPIHGNHKYCDINCRAMTNALRQKAQRTLYTERKKQEKPEIWIIRCALCGEMFEVSSHRRKYCDDCKLEQIRKHEEDKKLNYLNKYSTIKNSSKTYRPDRQPLKDGNCEICEIFGPLVRDHDNLCCRGGRYGTRCGNCERGRLCRKCNSGIGLLLDSIDLLSKAIKYLENYRTV